jgi:carbon starvation protein
MIQELAGMAYAPLKETSSWASNIIATLVCVGLWGYFLYQGAVDPLGGINTLWPLFGIANQMLAAIALMLATVVTVKLKRERYVLVPAIPAAWLVICTLTAGWQKLFDAKISFTAAAQKYAQGIADGKLLPPAKTAEEMQRIVTNNRVDMALTGLFMLLVLTMLFFSLRAMVRAWKANRPTAQEEPYVALSSVPASGVAH